MRKIYRYFIAIAALSVTFSCTQKEDVVPFEVKEEKTFTAYMADDPVTKTMIDGNIGDGYRKTLWLPEDSVGITMGVNRSVEKFVNTQTSNSEEGTFHGFISASGDTYYAIYPYSKSLKMDENGFIFNIPTIQRYKAGTFDTDVAPMVAKLNADSGNNSPLSFKHLCGVLVINLKGDETVKSISFTGKNAEGENLKISGDWTVDMSYGTEPVIAPTDSSLSVVTLECGDGVKLDPATPTPFYLVLPPATYTAFSVLVTTVEGEFMFKEASKPLTIKRANVTSAASLVYAQSIGFDLSVYGLANTYVVPQMGVYSFDASMVGNGAEGIVSGAGFHTESAEITPTSAELLWSEPSSLVSNIIYNAETKSISFLYLGEEGNAVIAAKDADGTTLWSWHIWCTDQPQEQKYVNSAGTFYVLDRNIGATRADRGTGDEWKESMGTLYFWGRKDPFNGKNHTSSGRKTLTMEETVHFPQNTHSTSGWIGNSSSWMSSHLKYAWTADVKTIYDPCPVGYKVASTAIWKDFTTSSMNSSKLEELNVAGKYDNGWYFYTDENKTNKAWYPVSHSYAWNGNYANIDPESHKVWSSDLSDNTTKYALQYVYRSDYDMTVNPAAYEFDGWAHPVRCMKDEGYHNLALATVSVVEIKGVTTTSATVVANVSDEGASEVTERGIVVGQTADLTLETGTKYSSGTGLGEFSVDLTDLTSLTRYYVRAYATNADGTSYSQVMSFTTEYEGEAVNLSAAGTANSYIVTDRGRDFIFDGGVKGNSTEMVGSPVSAEVIWETKNTTEAVAKGEIIKSVSLMDNGFVSFSIPTEYTPGNALIAVKDAEGVILWSWHIWVVDFDVEATRQTYKSGAVMMDRNLGALNVQENDPRAYGLLYQWGRKDPMCGVASADAFAQTYPEGIITRDATNSISEAIQNPTHFGTTPWNTDNTLWQSEKTKYDPCPVGWRVPDGGPDGVWSGFGTYSQDVANGAYFDTPYSTPRAFYPRGGYASQVDMKVYWHGGTSYHWSCTPKGDRAYDFQLWSGQGVPEDDRVRPSQFNVRCQKDNSTNSVSVPAVKINEIKDIQVTTAVVESEILRDGRSEVTERGVIWGEVANLSLENAPNKVVSDGQDNPFEMELTGLSDVTKYYVRAYARNSAGVGYSEEMSFTTEYSGEVKDLSANGTANSYIVNKYGIYSFDATVKGNSSTKVDGTPASAVVVWETRNTSESVTVGCVVKDVALENGKVKFTTSDDVTPGNALIAVKDADDYILWSWHIWVVDYKPELQYHTYPSGVVMMDRDLGALSNGTDTQSNGLLYQWGRKDPFMAPVGNNQPATTAPESAVKYEKTSAAKGTLAYVETIPTTMLYNDNRWQDWLYTRDHTLWGADKTMYDPCPEGWKVPDKSYGVWNNLSGVHYSTTGYSIENTNAEFGNDYWTSISPENNERAYSKNGDRGKVSPARVRCVMEHGLDVYITSIVSTDRAVGVVSNVTSVLSERVKEWGMLYSDSNIDMLITNANMQKVTDSEGEKSFGQFELSVDGLNPNSTYFVRVYVISEKGIGYSDIQTFQTKVSGDNEDFGDEDYEW